MSVFSSRSRFRPDTAHCNVPPGPSVHIRATSSTTNWPVNPVAPNTMIWYGLLLDVVSVAIVCVIRARRKHTDEVRETAAAPLLSLTVQYQCKIQTFSGPDCVSDKCSSTINPTVCGEDYRICHTTLK